MTSIGRRIRLSRVVAIGSSATAAVLASFAIFTSAAFGYDNMYWTQNFHPNCSDGNIGNYFCQTDNSALRWYRQSSISGSVHSRFIDVLEGPFEATDLNVAWQSPPSYSGSAETDIIYQAGSLPSNTLGITWCNDAVTNLRCDQHYIRFYVSIPSRKLICHESGHAIGLTHGAQAYPSIPNGTDSLHCLQTPAGQITDYYLGNYQSAEVNATY